MKVNIENYENQTKINEFKAKMEKIKTQLLEQYNEFLKEYDEEKKINLSELSAESNININMHLKYIDRLMAAKRNFNTCEYQYNRIVGELHDYYRFSWDKSTKLTEGAITKYVESHPSYNAINDVLAESKVLVQFLEAIVEGVKNRGFYIKNSIELRKIELGM